MPVKSNVKISQNFVDFSEYMIFTMLLESAVKTPKEKNVVGIKNYDSLTDSNLPGLL